jgi:2-keto-4-pentenoate hydratase/2-oxohepta-3-ene-1,7-dioic acid hydratase in catechol pathway
MESGDIFARISEAKFQRQESEMSDYVTGQHHTPSLHYRLLEPGTGPQPGENMDKIICVGKNYPDHAAELGDAHPEKPVLFMKPPSVLQSAHAVDERLNLILPNHSAQIHHELELVFRIDRDGYKMTVEEAQRALGAVTVGLDMTLRDLQTEAKKKGTPWTTGKVFVDAAVIGPWLRLSDVPNYLDEPFTLAVNDKIVQKATARQMSHSPAECLAYASQFFPICAGDILFTGTPAGVGSVQAGDKGVLLFGAVRYSVQWTNDIKKA